MVTTYIPKRNFFAPTKIQSIAKGLLKDCEVDRLRALDTYTYFKGMVDTNPEDDKSKSEMVKSLELSMSANDKKVKILDMMVKLTAQELRQKGSTNKTEDISFESLKPSVLGKSK
jgi:hypothetical protein